jgi:hypothetical protein
MGRRGRQIAGGLHFPVLMQLIVAVAPALAAALGLAPGPRTPDAGGDRGQIQRAGPDGAATTQGQDDAKAGEDQGAQPGRRVAQPQAGTVPGPPGRDGLAAGAGRRGRSIGPDADNGLAALRVRAERPPADAAVALGISDPSRQIIVRRRLGATADDTSVQLCVSYVPAELAEGT